MIATSRWFTTKNAPAPAAAARNQLAAPVRGSPKIALRPWKVPTAAAPASTRTPVLPRMTQRPNRRLSNAASSPPIAGATTGDATSIASNTGRSTRLNAVRPSSATVPIAAAIRTATRTTASAPSMRRPSRDIPSSVSPPRARAAPQYLRYAGGSTGTMPRCYVAGRRLQNAGRRSGVCGDFVSVERLRSPGFRIRAVAVSARTPRRRGWRGRC